ncbi:MAG: stage III sporulation protein SpoIIIAB [Caldicoprobacterales bacterium]|jgi:stage III sporulation protein AB|nr:stage III sporulation protein AB [Clostridiales bacterium]
MYFDLLISLVIITSSTLIGCEFAKAYRYRDKQLRQLQGALSRLEAEIIHYSTRLSDALQSVGESIEGEIGDLFILVSKLLDKRGNITVGSAWRMALKDLKDRLYLKKDELDILYRFGDQLGISDRNGQAKYIKLTLDQLYHQELDARETRKKYEKMYKSLGLLGGIGIAVLLI